MKYILTHPAARLHSEEGRTHVMNGRIKVLSWKTQMWNETWGFNMGNGFQKLFVKHGQLIV